MIAAWPEEAFARIGGIDRATYIAVLTHDPKLDDAALTIALRSDAAYVGAMGSRRAQAQRRERLLAAGLDEELLERIAAPIGLDLGAIRPRRPRCRSWPRWWRCGTAARAAGSPQRGAASTRWALDRRPRARRGRLHALRRAKQLAELDGRPLLEHALRAMGRATVDRVVVVLGAAAEQIAASVDLHGAEPLVCERWDEGQSASLAFGLAELADCEAVVVTLGDQPRCRPTRSAA